MRSPRSRMARLALRPSRNGFENRASRAMLITSFTLVSFRAAVEAGSGAGSKFSKGVGVIVVANFHALRIYPRRGFDGASQGLDCSGGGGVVGCQKIYRYGFLYQGFIFSFCAYRARVVRARCGRAAPFPFP